METEVYLVLLKRQDGALPDPVKLMHTPNQQGLHFIRECAVAAMQAVNAELGSGYAGVFRALLTVVEDVTPRT